jgi:hypothetical protein
MQEWHQNGQPKSESWCVRGRVCREDGFAYHWDESGTVVCQE